MSIPLSVPTIPFPITSVSVPIPIIPVVGSITPTIPVPVVWTSIPWTPISASPRSVTTISVIEVPSSLLTEIGFPVSIVLGFSRLHLLQRVLLLWLLRLPQPFWQPIGYGSAPFNVHRYSLAINSPSIAGFVCLLHVLFLLELYERIATRQFRVLSDWHPYTLYSPESLKFSHQLRLRCLKSQSGHEQGLEGVRSYVIFRRFRII
mmetsp:Transcript_19120/g.27717  ORF Transcript_19120/g.27717 Transcript_19120/m.27717 type:complete len:205 (+) Transcript_19120:460-1074(+)